MPGKNELGYEIKVLSNLLKRKVFEVAPPPGAGKLTEMQRRIMGFLHENPDREIYQRDIEDFFCIRRSTASRLLKGMEASGHILRQSVSRDARLKKITPTPQSQGIHQGIQDRIQEVEGILKKGLSQAEIDQFIATAEKIKQNLS